MNPADAKALGVNAGDYVVVGLGKTKVVSEPIKDRRGLSVKDSNGRPMMKDKFETKIRVEDGHLRDIQGAIENAVKVASEKASSVVGIGELVSEITGILKEDQVHFTPEQIMEMALAVSRTGQDETVMLT